MGRAVTQLFKGDFSGAAKTAGDAAAKLTLGVEDFTDKVKAAAQAAGDFADELNRDVRAAIALEQQLNKIKVAERELRVERAEANKVIEQQKFIAEDITKSFNERIGAARAAGELERSLLSEQLSLERQRLSVMLQQAQLNETDEETFDAIADQRVRIAELEAASTTKQIELNNKLNGLLKEQEAIQQAKADFDREFLAAAEAEEEIIEYRLNRELDLQIQGEQKKREEYTKTELERQRIEEEGMANRRAQEDAELEFVRAREAAKASIISNALAQVAGLAGQGTAFGKALAISAATISSYQAFTNALANTPLPPPFPQIAAGAALASGIAQVRNIAAQQPPAPPAGLKAASGGSVSAPTVSAPITPQFNIGGGASLSNQIAAGIGNGLQGSPVRTYVVSGEVSTNQALDRRIRANATFG